MISLIKADVFSAKALFVLIQKTRNNPTTTDSMVDATLSLFLMIDRSPIPKSRATNTAMKGIGMGSLVID